MDDVVKRLRDSASIGVSHPHFMSIAQACVDGAAEIERLQNVLMWIFGLHPDDPSSGPKAIEAAWNAWKRSTGKDASPHSAEGNDR